MIAGDLWLLCLVVMDEHGKVVFPVPIPNLVQDQIVTPPAIYLPGLKLVFFVRF